MTTPVTTKEPAFMNAKEVAAWLHVSERKVWRMPDSGLVPQPLKFGGASRWSTATLQEWIAGGAKPTNHSTSATERN